MIRMLNKNPFINKLYKYSKKKQKTEMLKTYSKGKRAIGKIGGEGNTC